MKGIYYMSVLLLLCHFAIAQSDPNYSHRNIIKDNFFIRYSKAEDLTAADTYSYTVGGFNQTGTAFDFNVYDIDFGVNNIEDTKILVYVDAKEIDITGEFTSGGESPTMRFSNHIYEFPTSNVPSASQGEFNNNIVVTWEPVVKEDVLADLYFIYASKDGSWTDEESSIPIGMTTGDVFSFNHTGLNVSANFHYRVQAFKYLWDKTNAWATRPSTSIYGSTKPIELKATAMDESTVRISWENSTELYRSTGENAVHVNIKNQDGNTVFDKTDYLQDHITGSLSDLEIELSGGANGGTYAKLHESFFERTDEEAWSFEMTGQITSSGVVLSNAIGDLMEVDETSNTIKIYGETTGVACQLNALVNYQLVNQSGKLTLYQNGLSVWEGSQSAPPQYINGNNAHQNFANMSLKGIRLWNVVRTPEQIVNDSGKWYDKDAIKPAGLINQYIFDDETQADNSGLYEPGLTEVVVQVESTDLTTYKITFRQSYPETLVSHFVEDHKKPGDRDTYEIKLFEYGSGQVISQATAEVETATKYTEAKTDQLSANFLINQTVINYTSNRHADKTIIYRININSGDSAIINSRTHQETTYDAENNIVENTKGNLNISFVDTYEDERLGAAVANCTYKYGVVHYYEGAGYYDREAVSVTTISTDDYGFAATINAAGDEASLTWDQTLLEQITGTPNVRIIKNGEPLAGVTGKDLYTDFNTIPGDNDNYGLQAMNGDEVVFTQYVSLSNSQNGQVSGYFLSENYDIPLKNTTYIAKLTQGGELEEVAFNSDGPNGEINKTGLYYGEYDFEDTEIAKGFSLSVNEPTQPKMYLKTTKEVPASEVSNAVISIGFGGSNTIEEIHQENNGNRIEVRVNNIEEEEQAGYEFIVQFYIDGVLNDIQFGGTLANNGKQRRFVFYHTDGELGREYAYKAQVTYLDVAQGKYLVNTRSLAAEFPEEMDILGDLTATAEQNDAYENGLDACIKTQISVDPNFIPYTNNNPFVAQLVREDASGNQKIIAEESILAGIEMNIIDNTFVPNHDYQYWFQVVTNDKVVEKSNVVNLTGPLLSANLTAQILGTATTHAGQVVQINVSEDISGITNYHGLALFKNGKIVDEIANSQVTSENKYLMKNGEGNFGDIYDLTLKRYKNTIEGRVYFADQEITTDHSGGFGAGGGTISHNGYTLANQISGEDFTKFTFSYNNNAPQVTDLSETKVYENYLVDNPGTSVLLQGNSFAGSLTSHGLTSHGLRIEARNNQGQVMSSTSLNSNETTGSATEGMEPLVNFSVTDDLSRTIVASWETESYSRAMVEIRADGQTLDIVPIANENYSTGVSIFRNEAIAIQARKVYDEDGDGVYEQYSRWSTGLGIRKEPHHLEGYAMDKNHHRVPHVQVVVGANTVLTDAAGYYRLTFYPAASQTDVIRTVAEFRPSTLSDLSLTRTIALNEQESIYKDEFILDSKIFKGRPEGYQYAQVDALTAYTNPKSNTVDLKAQTTDGNYTSVQFLDATIEAGTKFSFDEEQAVTVNQGTPGLSTTYVARTVHYDREGEPIHGKSKKVQIEYPHFDPLGEVWSEDRDGYNLLIFPHNYPDLSVEIKRDGVTLEIVKNGEQEYLDRTGIQGKTYIYEFQAKLPSGIEAESVNRLSSVYPTRQMVSDLATVVNEENGSVRISYTPHQEGGVMKLYQNDVLVQTASNESTTSFVVTNALPAAFAHFKVVSDNDLENNSYIGQTIDVLFPDIPPVSSVSESVASNQWTKTITLQCNAASFKDIKVQTTEQATGETNTIYLPAEEGVTEYSFVLDGKSGANYAVELTVRDERQNTIHESAPYVYSTSHPILPTPSLEVESEADDYVLLKMTYPDGISFDQWNLTIEKEILDVQTSETVNFPPKTKYYALEDGHGKYLFKLSTSVEDGVSQPSPEKGISRSLGIENNSGVSMSAQAEENAINLTFNSDLTSNVHYSLKRDGDQITYWHWPGNSGNSNEEWNYRDNTSVKPGHSYEYKLLRTNLSTGTERSTSKVISAVKSEGKITTSVVNTMGDGVSGIKMYIHGELKEGTFRTIYKEAETDVDGAVVFTNLPDNAVEYAVGPVDDFGFDVMKKTTVLSENINEKLIMPFIDQSAIEIAGVLYNALGAKVKNKTVVVYAIDEEGVETKVDEVFTTTGAYSVLVSIDQKVKKYKVAVERDANNEADDLPSWFDEKELSAVDISYGDILTADLKDETMVPIEITLSEAGCESFDENIKAEIMISSEDGETHIPVTVVGGSTSVDLPIDNNWFVRVLRFTPITSFTKRAEDQMSTMRWAIGRKDAAIAYIQDNPSNSDFALEEIAFETSKELVFYDRPVISVTLEGNDSCTDTDGNLIHYTESGGNLMASVDVNVTTRSGEICPIKEGSIEVRDGIGNSLSSDELNYNTTLSSWGNYHTRVAEINPGGDYTKPLEFILRDRNGNILARKYMALVVIGSKAIEGTQIIEDLTIVPKPVAYLQDGPGSQSFSRIAEGTEFITQFANYKEEKSSKESQTLWENRGLLSTDLKYRVLEEKVIKKGERAERKMVVENAISTSSDYSFLQATQEYQQGPASDIIISTAELLTFGSNIVVSKESSACKFKVNKKLAVSSVPIPAINITTIGAINAEISKLTSVLNDEQVVWETEGSRDKVVASKLDYEKLLLYADTFFDPRANLCNSASQLKNALPGNQENGSIGLGPAVERLEDIEEFCTNETSLELTTEGYYKIVLAEDEVWDETQWSSFEDMAKKFKAAQVYGSFVTLYQSGGPLNKQDEQWKGYSEMASNFKSALDDLDMLNTDGWEMTQIRNKVLDDLIKNELDLLVADEPYQVVSIVGGGSSFSKNISSSYSATYEEKFGFVENHLVNFALGIKREVDLEYTNFISGLGMTLFNGENLFLSGLETNSFDSYERTISHTKVNFKNVSYVLQDDDPGDKLSVRIHENISSPLAPSGIPLMYEIIGGLTSCPQEKGTQARVDLVMQAVDEDGVSRSNKYFVPAGEIASLRLSIQNVAVGAENPLAIGITGGRNTGFVDNVQLNSQGGIPLVGLFASIIHMYGNEIIIIRITASPLFSPVASLELVPAKVDIHADMPCTATDLGPKTAKFTFELSFEKATAKADFERLTDIWVINDLRPLLSFIFKDTEHNNPLYQMQDIQVLVNTVNGGEDEWRNITNELTGSPFITRQEFIDGNGTWVWDPQRLGLVDGNYVVRVEVTGEQGGSHIGPTQQVKVDRQVPFAAKVPEPSDGILSKGDGISVKMNEAIKAGEAYANLTERIRIDIYEKDKSQVLYTLIHDQDPTVSDFTLSISGGDIDVVLSENIRSNFDGYPVLVSLDQLKDHVDNVSNLISWWFVLDSYNRPVSDITVEIQDLPLDSDGNQHYINASIDAANIRVYAKDIDPFHVHSLLDFARLQSRPAGGGIPGVWTDFGTLQVADMQTGTNFLDVDLSNFEDGRYQIRWIAHGETSTRTSDPLVVIKDTQAPTVLAAPDIIERTNSFDVRFNKPVTAFGGVNLLAGITAIDGTLVAFTAVSATINAEDNQVITFVLDPASNDYYKLFEHYGGTLDLSTMFNLQDKAGNSWSGELEIPIGNFTQNVAEVQINYPTNFVMNIADQTETFGINLSDLSSKDKSLDSLQLIYRSDKGVTGVVNTWTRTELLVLHNAGTPLTGTWDISTATGSGLSDGEYQVMAVAWGNKGRPNYSAPIKGGIDRTAPRFAGVYTPANNTFATSDSEMSFTFTEPLSSGSEIEVRETVAGVQVLVDASLYYKMVDANKLTIIPNENFKVIYSQSPLNVRINGGIEDLYGNPNIGVDFVDMTMANFGHLQVGARQATELAAESVETGEIEVSWTSYQLFDETILERSRDGQTFIEVANYSGTVSSHMDEVNFNSVIFYRLKQMQDTTVTYSKTIGLENDNRVPVLVTHLYPNPSNGSTFDLSVLTNNMDEEMSMRIIDIHGKVVYEETIEAQSVLHSNATFELENPLRSGIYHMVLEQGKKTSKLKLVVVSESGQP